MKGLRVVLGLELNDTQRLRGSWVPLVPTHRWQSTSRLLHQEEMVLKAGSA